MCLIGMEIFWNGKTEKRTEMDRSKVTQRLVRKRDVAEILSCSVRTVDRLVAKGELSPVKILGSKRYKVNEIEMLIQKVGI